MNYSKHIIEILSDIIFENHGYLSKYLLTSETLRLMNATHICKPIIEYEGIYFVIINLHDIFKEGIL